MDKEIYFNFPIQLLSGFMVDSEKVLNNIMDYAVYRHSLNLEFGSDSQKIKDSASHFGITLGNASETRKKGSLLFDSIPEKSPIVGIGKTILFEFYKNEKSEFEKICLLGYLAIRSILGTKEYCLTNNSLWLARMDAQSKAVKAEKFVLPNEYDIQLSVEINKYAKEYQTKKIKAELRNNWGLVTYSRFTKGFYISYKLELKALIIIAETRRKSNAEKEFKLKEKELIKEVLKKLNSRPLHDH